MYELPDDNYNFALMYFKAYQRALEAKEAEREALVSHTKLMDVSN